jgi:hypothetical protein
MDMHLLKYHFCPVSMLPLQNDGWNADGTTPYGTPQAQRFSDYSNFIPSNTPYQLTDITKWQPLIESKRDGYFVAQTHVAVQIQSNKIQPYSMDAAAFYSRFNISNGPYPDNMNDAAALVSDAAG